jgi:hypothetical protein
LSQGYQVCSIDEVAGMSTIVASSQSETGSVLQLSDNPEVTTTEIMDDVFDCIDDYIPDINEEEEQCEEESQKVKEDDQEEETDLLPDNQENDTILFLLQHKEAIQFCYS